MNKITTLAIFLVFAFSVQNCDEGILDVTPETEIGRENFFNSADDLQMYLNSMINWKNVMDLNHELSDDATTTGTNEIRDIMTNDLTSQNFTSGWDWERLRNINYFLENFGNADISEEALNHFEGVARFHRARFYMDKVQRFGDVPWYDKVLESDDPDLYKTQDSREYVIERIFEDLTFAIEYVRFSADVGDVSNDVVRAFTARYALYEGTFRKYHDYLGLTSSANDFIEIARDQARYLMDNGGYSIYNTGDPSAYGALFNSPDLQGNPEVILLNRSISSTRNSGWWAAGFGQYEQSHTKDIVQAYLMNDGTFYSSQVDYESNSYVEEFTDRDPRLYESFAHPGWIIINTGTYAQGTSGSEYFPAFNRNFTGYQTIKWFVNDTDVTVQESVDTPVLRYAETLLIFAEAMAELGSMSQAVLDETVNELRARVGMPDLTMAVALDPVLATMYPGISDNVLLEIRRERRVELFNEDHRFNDVVRYGRGELFQTVPRGPFFSGLGNHDLTGDGEPDVKLIAVTESIPAPEDREENGLGVRLVYYRAGSYDSDATIFLEDGTSGAVLARDTNGTFQAPKHYYRPIPYTELQLNPNLQQIFGWQ